MSSFRAARRAKTDEPTKGRTDEPEDAAKPVRRGAGRAAAAARTFFQWLEKVPRIFPTIGKSAEGFSNGWKNARGPSPAPLGRSWEVRFPIAPRLGHGARKESRPRWGEPSENRTLAARAERGRNDERTNRRNGRTTGGRDDGRRALGDAASCRVFAQGGGAREAGGRGGEVRGACKRDGRGGGICGAVPCLGCRADSPRRGPGPRTGHRRR